MTIVMVTHDSDVASHAHRIIEMRDGIIVGEQAVQAPTAPRRPRPATVTAPEPPAPVSTLCSVATGSATPSALR